MKLNMMIYSFTYSNLKLHPILSRRKCFDVKRNYSLLNSNIDCPEILNLIPINFHQASLRSYLMLYITTNSLTEL